MPEVRTPGPAARGPGEHRLQRASTALLRALYTGTALLGLLFTPPLLSLVLGPALAASVVLLLAAVVWSVQEHWPTRRTLTTTAAVALALLPFGHAVVALGALGKVLALLVLVLLTVAAIGVVSPSGPQPRRPRPAHLARGADVRLRELLQVLPLPALLTEWRALSQLRPDAHADAVVAAELRSMVLDELQHRDPAGFSRWLSSGAFDPPDEHFRHDQDAAS